MSFWFTTIGTVSTVSADDFPRATIYRVPAGEKPVIDGDLTDAVWQITPTLTSFHQVIPTEGAPPSARTEVHLAYDSGSIYVGVRCYHNENYIQTAHTLIQGQSILADDRVGIRLDTFNDRRNAYLFEVNANGIRRDALITNDNINDDWDAVWTARVRSWSSGWTAEFAIPIAALSFDPGSTTWGFNFSRSLPRVGEQVAWSSQATELSPAVSGYVTGISDLDTGFGLRVTPSLSLRYTEADSLPSAADIDPSLTAFYAITPFLTAGLTLNTDFSATEADQRQINLTRFSLFFPEKRDFFLQDASIFEFGNIQENSRPFFSRRIGLSRDGMPLGIDSGLKLTGRITGWNIGALAVQQDAGTPGGDNSVFVGRVTKNVLAESSVGAIVTSGDPLSASASSLAGVDVSFRNSQFLGANTIAADLWYQRSDSETYSDNQDSYGIRIRYPNDRIDGSLEWIRIEENFNPALGFVNRRGIVSWRSSIRYRKRMVSGFTEWIGQRLRTERIERIGGGLDSKQVQFNFFELKTRGDDIFFVFYNRETDDLLEPFTIGGRLTVPPSRYESDRYGFILESGLQRQFSFIVQIADGEFFGGSNLRKRLALEWRPSRHFFASIGVVQNDIELPAGRVRSQEIAGRLNVAFNARWSWLNFFQFDNFSETVSINSRLRFEPGSNQAYFLVVNALVDESTNETTDVAFVLNARYTFQL